MGAPRIDGLDKNYITNGSCQFWQRSILTGQGTERNGYNSIDRFKLVTSNTAGTRQLERVQDSPNARTKYCGKASFETTGSSTFQIVQRIESLFARDLINKNLSFRGHFQTDEFQSIRIIVNIPTVEDNYAGVTQIYNQVYSQDIGENWEDFKLENFITPGASVANGLEIIIQAENPNEGANSHYFKWAQLKLNIGTTAQEFSHAGRGLIEELQYCLRYYEKSYNLDVTPGTAGITTGAAIFSSDNSSINKHYFVEWKVRKRTIPATTRWSTETGAVGNIQLITSGGASGGDYSGGSFQDSERGAFFNATFAEPGARFGWATDAEL